MGEIETKLASMGVIVPDAAPPAANYVPFVQAGAMLFTSGQLPLRDGALVASGAVGDGGLDMETGRTAARQCAINVIAQIKAAASDLDRVSRIVKITVFVASRPGFTQQHLVANGASDLLAEAFGEAGRHARAAVGVSSLPLDAAVEVEAIVELK